MTGKLSSLQERVVELLSDIDPAWTLSGGGALAAVHLRHRHTRDLDLFWHGRQSLDRLPDEVAHRLRSAGLSVSPVQRAPAFSRFVVAEGADQVVVDLVAEPVPVIEKPLRERIGQVQVWVDTPHEILVNKLCALLGRAEVRDLVDVKALVEGGQDLRRGVQDAPSKDAGFSALTLAWVLDQLAVAPLARSVGLSERETEDLIAFRDSLVRRLAGWARAG